MGKPRFTSNPYPHLVLSAVEREALLQLERDLILEMFPTYEAFVVTDHRNVNRAQWQAIGHEKNLHVYVERKNWHDEPCMDAHARDGSDHWQRHMPTLLAVGTFEGALNDLMFGTVNPTQEMMRIKASYVQDYSDGAVLANLVLPTRHDPFRSVSVKWTQINLPLHQTGLIHNRDFVCLEATGVLHFADGDRVGYQLLHSIDFPTTAPRPGTIRARHKIIGFYRQRRRNVIDTFAVDTVHPGGHVFRSVALEAAAKALLSTTNYVRCGHAKKLTWTLQHRHAETRGTRRRTLFHAPRSCSTCARTLASRRFAFLPSVGKRVCKLCLETVCPKCTRSHGLSFLTPNGALVRQKVTFCVRCMSHVTHMDAVPAARDQARGDPAYNAIASLSGSELASDCVDVP